MLKVITMVIQIIRGLKIMVYYLKLNVDFLDTYTVKNLENIVLIMTLKTLLTLILNLEILLKKIFKILVMQQKNTEILVIKKTLFLWIIYVNQTQNHALLNNND
jgi:hypothetical protein